MKLSITHSQTNFCYADGSSLDVPIVVGTSLRDLDRPWGEAPRTTVVWTAKNGNRLSRFDWTNPYPERGSPPLISCETIGRSSPSGPSPPKKNEPSEFCLHSQTHRQKRFSISSKGN